MRWVLAILVAAVLVTAGALWLQSQREAPAGPVAQSQPAAAPPESHYPVPTPEPAEESEPLPEQIDGSDAAVRAGLEDTFGKAPVESFLLPDEFVRRFVALIDSLDRHPVPLRFRPMKHVEGVPVTQPQGEYFLLQPEDANRYAPWVDAFSKIDARKACALYLRYYPLLQKAYEDLGYPGGYFNDRVIRIIDHLLAAPEPDEPLMLVRPKVLYLFADPALEQRSWGQKALIRMRKGNADVVKAKLREIRAILAVNEEKRPAP